MSGALLTLFLLAFNIAGLVFTTSVSLYKYRRGLEITNIDTIAFFINVAAVLTIFGVLVIEVFT